MADETKNDYIVLYFASMPQPAELRERKADALKSVITNFSPSCLSDLDSLRTKANALLRANELEIIADIDYFPNAALGEVEARAKEKNIPFLDFALHLGFGRSLSTELPESLRQLQSKMQNLAPNFDDTNGIYQLHGSNGAGDIFIEITYSDFKSSGRCSTKRGIYGFLKDTINKMLSEKYVGEKELPKLIGDDRTTPAWYEAKLTELADFYYDKKALKDISSEKFVFGKEKESVLASMTEDEVMKALSKAHAVGKTSIIQKPAADKR
ncbi:hypothetical protein HYT92_01815 [Candidatus Pacearchaeota archaeon]|nr:hypothetical protein [Candidatus Pacearchaeota archaeon]